MTKHALLVIFLLGTGLLLGIAFAPPLTSVDDPAGEVDLAAVSDSIERLARRIQAATVFLEVTKESGTFGSSRRRRDSGGESRGRTIQGWGSGFVIDAARGYVVTNAHVVGDENSSVQATLNDGRSRPADVIAVDPATDLAVVKIPPGFARRQLSWGDSFNLHQGSLVLAVGSPFGLEGTATFGVVSGRNREVPGLPGSRTGYQDYIQFDAFIDQGSSGGPLVNMAGDVVGVNTAIFGESWRGISYAVPSGIAQYVSSELIEHKTVRRGWLGVNLDKVDAERAETVGLGRPYGAVITEIVDEDGPAAKGGLRRGDIILAVNGMEVASFQNLRARIATLPPGETVTLRIWRRGAPSSKKVVLGQRTENL